MNAIIVRIMEYLMKLMEFARLSNAQSPIVRSVLYEEGLPFVCIAIGGNTTTTLS